MLFQPWETTHGSFTGLENLRPFIYRQTVTYTTFTARSTTSLLTFSSALLTFTVTSCHSRSTTHSLSVVRMYQMWNPIFISSSSAWMLEVSGVCNSNRSQNRLVNLQQFLAFFRRSVENPGCLVVQSVRHFLWGCKSSNSQVAKSCLPAKWQFMRVICFLFTFFSAKHVCAEKQQETPKL